MGGSRLLFCLVLLAMLLSPVDRLEAGARRFTYVYEATTSPPKTVESENWITWRTGPAQQDRFNAIDFRHELEFGLTEHLQLGVYLADWSYREDPAANRHGTKFEDAAVELIYNLTNPTTDILGSAVYAEFRGGPEELELESKIILQKNLGQFVIAYNGTLESIWEGDRFEEKSGELSEALGLSYEISPRFLLGAELLHEIDLPDWSGAEDSVVYAGPNVSYRWGNWWATVTPLVQLSDVTSEADVQTRLILGFSF